MTGRHRRPADLAIVARTDEATGEPVIHLAFLPDGPVARLEGSAAVIWSAAVADDDDDHPGDLVEWVATRTGSDPADIAAQVAAFVDELVTRGLLDR